MLSWLAGRTHIFQKGTSPENAKEQIFQWIYLINKTDFTYLKSFAKTIWKRLNTVLNWFTDTVSNGMAEGINNVIKTLLKRGYGYKDFTYFRLKVLQKCGMLMNYATHSF